MRLNLYLVLITIFLSKNVLGSFAHNTPVQVARDHCIIGDLQQGEMIQGYKSGRVIVGKITYKCNKLESDVVAVILADETILASANQFFYDAKSRQWKPAKNLAPGEQLLTIKGDSVSVVELHKDLGSMELCEIEVENCHNYFVSRSSVLVHNEPFSIGFGLSWAFGSGAIEYAGATLFAGIAGLFGLTLFKDANDKYEAKPELLFGNTDLKAQAPGQPTNEDGYEPPKNWDGKKVKHPKTGQCGYPDKKGKVWVPSGPKGHGGPHWDVVDRDGGRKNVLPGGRER